MEHYRAKAIAKEVLNTLVPHCDKVAISGELAQKKPEIDRIEIVAIPKFYDTGLFMTGVALILNKLAPIQGALPNFCIVRMLPEGIPLHFYNCDHYNYGYILAWGNSPTKYRTIIKSNWIKKGYDCKERHLTCDGKNIQVPDEHSFFKRIDMPFLEPELR